MSWTSEPAAADATVEDAVAAVREGRPVCVHDAADREGEVDLIYPAQAVTPDALARLRNDAGGLICVALGPEVADAFDLPFFSDAVEHPAIDDDVPYGDRSSFSLTVNHRETHTGITDDDRALTIRELGTAASDPAGTDFAATFRSPGHVHLLRGAAGGLAERQGHTELALVLARAAGRPPAMVVCEMLDDETGGALDAAAAERYAERHGLPYVEGRQLVAALS
jgi:3,4-dihydroxy 2-butanone 4-phosphate synthase